jgi:hypothetical protein
VTIFLSVFNGSLDENSKKTPDSHIYFCLRTYAQKMDVFFFKQAGTFCVHDGVFA